MRQKFSTKWKASKQPRKQRKYLANAPLHLKRKMFAAILNKELRKKYEMKNIEVRKGDEVMILKGTFKKKTGKISEANTKKMKVSVEGIQRTKKDGSKVNVWFYPSTLMIINLNADDRKRMKNKEIKKQGEKNVPEKK